MYKVLTSFTKQSVLYNKCALSSIIARVAELAKGAGLKIPYLVFRGFESHPSHHFVKITFIF